MLEAHAPDSEKRLGGGVVVRSSRLLTGGRSPCLWRCVCRLNGCAKRASCRDLGPANLLLECISLNGYLTRNCATLVAIGPLKKYVNHEVEAENANCQKHRSRHGNLPGAGGYSLS
jgi:hypothetical protein